MRYFLTRFRLTTSYIMAAAVEVIEGPFSQLTSKSGSDLTIYIPKTVLSCFDTNYRKAMADSLDAKA